MANYEIKLRIADIIIKMQSIFAIEQLSEEEKGPPQVDEQFYSFFYTGRQKPDVLINVEIVEKLPQIRGTRPVFITYHFEDGQENWRLLKKGNAYIYKCPIERKKQLMLINKSFNRVTAYLLPKKNKGFVWHSSDIIYDFLQVLLISYLAQRNQGIFTHSVGIKDLDGQALVFNGKSGSGKSTLARLWRRHSRATVLNDDRIIVRKVKGRFFVYSSPWHGEFNDYVSSRIDSAHLERLFFIHHAPENTLRKVLPKEAFNLLYPALFPTLWDKKCVENIASFCQDLVKNVSCFRLGFVNDKRMIGFARKICKKSNTEVLA